MNQNNSERDSERYRMDKVWDEKIALSHNKVLMREYKITKSNLWYNVYRKKEEDWFIYLEWLQKNTYTLNRDYARVFYTIEDAVNNLLIARRKWKETDTISKETGNSWDKKES